MTVYKVEFDFAPKYHVRLASYVAPSELVTSRHVFRFPLIHQHEDVNITKMLFERTIKEEPFGMTLVSVDGLHQKYTECLAHRTSLQVAVSDTFDVTLICEGKFDKEFQDSSIDYGNMPGRILTSFDAHVKLRGDNGSEFGGEQITKISLVADRDMKLVYGQIRGFNQGLQQQGKSLIELFNGLQGKGCIDLGYKLKFNDEEEIWIANLDGIKMEISNRCIKDGCDIIYADFKTERRY